MEAIISELPLVIFTACVIIGAGGFVALGVAAAADRVEPAEGSRQAFAPVGGTQAVPLVFLTVVLVGFVAAFFHLASPLHAAFALTGIGRSPMSNEIAMGVVFTLAAIVVCVLRFAGKLSAGANRVASIVLAVLGLVFVAFTGAAYMMRTIVTWSTPFSIVESVGLTLFAGPVLYTALTSLLGGDDVSKRGRMVQFVVAIFGVIVGFGFLGLHVVWTGSLHSGMTSGSALVGEVAALLAVAFALGMASLLACWRLLAGKPSGKAPATAAVVCAAVAIVMARLVFYGIQLSVGL
jgi:DMSO reductase anchor subunit